MCPVADEQLIECQQLLAILPQRSRHASLFNSEAIALPFGLQPFKHVWNLLWSEGAENPLIGRGIRIDSDRQLPAEVFGSVRDESILANDENDVIRREEETVQGITLNSDAALVGRECLLDGPQSLVEARLLFEKRFDSLTA